MVELQRTFSFDEQILPHLLRDRETFSGRLAEEGYDSEAAKERLQVRLVGQEKDNSIILTWIDIGPNGRKAEPKVTYFGLYEPSQRHLKRLFVYDKEVVVTGASVNQERTLLAFTIAEQCYGSSDDPSSSHSPAIYTSFLAEIRGQNCIYSFFNARHTFQKVQFLYGDYAGYGSSSKKESHMLFLHHKEAIGLYHFPMARFGDKGMIMSDQPRIQQVADEFFWAEWDCRNQRLYIVYPKHKRVNSGLDEDEEEIPDLMFVAYQFNDKSTHVKVLKFPLPFTGVDLFRKTSHPEYADILLSHTISEKHVNMQVVTLPGKGSFYICLQHPTSGGTEGSRNDTEESVELSNQLEYSVYVLHHGCLMKCVLPTVRPSKELNYRLFFSSLDNYLMVFLPGRFMHLLNCGTEREPSHHIILQDDAVPTFSSEDAVPNEPRLLSILNKEFSTSLRIGPYIFDCASGNAFKYGFNKEALAELFAKTHMPSTRLAILHLAVIHLRDSNLTRKIFEHLSQDPASPECLDLLREYLVGATYGTFRRELQGEPIALIPFTCVDTYRGHLEKDVNRKRIAQISFSFVRDIPIEFQSVKSKMKQGEFWIAVLRNTKRLPPRFKLNVPTPEFHDEDWDGEEEVEVTPSHSGLRRSLQKRLSTAKKFSSSSDSLTSLTSIRSKGSVDTSEESRSVAEIKKQNMTIDRLVSYLQNHLPKEAKGKIYNIAIEYVNCQARQCEQLLRLFVQALEFTDNPFSYPLYSRGTMREVVFFQLVERFSTAVTELSFPLPSGFRTSMTCLGFRCLERRLFLQYVDNSVLQLTKGFITRLVEEFDLGEREEEEFVFRIICRLKHSLAKEALMRWDHPFKARLFSQRLVEDLLNKDPSGGRENPESHQAGRGNSLQSGFLLVDAEPPPDADSDSFLPLTNLMKTLRYNAAEVSKQTVTPVDLDYVEEQALLETQREIVGSLGTIPF
ncbi:gamma-secretase-activating protein-like isoform X2 [Stylophora pistillata]|uniref:Gamma-secretase-activating protein n=1 Tax=Stylophora pistillata TaxID=50429 RepID=A0A2B4SRU1_STYPI|nr:gamma-secretase-activating protein-like isoform X2 [Stylophora pistillata]PFX31262.1 Gamma-secretase-activating protein [Stylophora pistillata]